MGDFNWNEEILETRMQIDKIFKERFEEKDC
jgi:hypothetical protein